MRYGPSYKEWCALDSNVEDAKFFFQKALNPWIQRCGYSWTMDLDKVEQKFIKFAYALEDVHSYNRAAGSERYRIELPEVTHRNFPEDRDTYDLFVDLYSFSDLLDEWREHYTLLENPMIHLLYEFCYLYVDVEDGQPGKFTEKALDADKDSDDEDSGKGISNTALPDMYDRRQRNELY
jgi:hypothetical protein